MNLNIYRYIYIYILKKNTLLYKRCAPVQGFDCVFGNVCACLFWGVNSRFTFPKFESILALLVYLV